MEGYAYEQKFDGWRCGLHVPAGILHTRKHSDITERFPEVLDAARALPGRVVLDGELVAYRDGRLVFEALNWSRRHRAREGVTVVFRRVRPDRLPQPRSTTAALPGTTASAGAHHRPRARRCGATHGVDHRHPAR